MEPTGERSDEHLTHAQGLIDTAAPQWSRPANGRMRTVLPPMMNTVLAPQWSRPANGRMSRPRAEEGAVVEGAAMEPTGERSDETLAPVADQLVLPAAMEPTGERSDEASAGLQKISA